MVSLSLARSLPISVLLTTLRVTGVVVSKLAGKSFSLSARGFHRLVDCTKSIIFGSIRACPFVHSYPENLYLKTPWGRAETSRLAKRCAKIPGSWMAGQVPCIRRVFNFSICLLLG